ncbi:MAG: PD-(D/E)XK nuclease family protein [Elusimicrobia bacterium]|nr:PD-(D/E)XK nuclease family protein [Elusimicrobiota bacterium]
MELLLMKALSHSSIGLYKECPQRFKFRYVDGIKEGPRSYFSFGQSVHTALEFMYRSQLIAPSLQEILRHYETHWVSEGYASAHEEQTKKVQGARMVEAYYDKHIQNWQPAMATEHNFSIELDGAQIRGKIDRVDRLPSGALHVIDYKTGKSFSPERTQEDKQLTLYQIACEESFGASVEKLTLYHVPSLREADSPRHSSQQVASLRREIIQVKISIDQKVFDPKPDDYKCRWCDYKKICPAWVTPEAPGQPAKRGPASPMLKPLPADIAPKKTFAIPAPPPRGAWGDAGPVRDGSTAAPPWVAGLPAKSKETTVELINRAIKKTEELNAVLKEIRRRLPGTNGF